MLIKFELLEDVSFILCHDAESDRENLKLGTINAGPGEKYKICSMKGPKGAEILYKAPDYARYRIRFNAPESLRWGELEGVLIGEDITIRAGKVLEGYTTEKREALQTLRFLRY